MRQCGAVSTKAYIALGSNLGDRRSHLRDAVRRLSELPQTCVTSVSPVYETAPVGPEGQGPYLNAAVGVSTRLDATALRRALVQIEDASGRDRSVPRWGPRTLDMDLLLFGSQRVETDELTVPHPRMHERWFVLRPLCDIAPDARVPGTGHEGAGRSVAELLERVEPDALARPPEALVDAVPTPSGSQP